MKTPKETRAEVTIGGKKFRAKIVAKPKKVLQKFLGLWYDVGGNWHDATDESGESDAPNENELP